MIRVNLAPREELDSQFWFMPDVLLLLVVFLVANAVVEGQLTGLQDEVAQTMASRDDYNERAQKIQPELEKFKNLGKDKENLLVKLRALQAITGSRIAKFKPLIAIEHLQNLKPDGVWLQSLSVEDTQVGLDALALDNILVAEFITALKSTQFQDIDPSDLRTQVFFSNVTLSGTSSVGPVEGVNQPTDVSGGGTVRFRLTLSIGERLPPSPAPGSKQASVLKVRDPGRSGGPWWMQES